MVDRYEKCCNVKKNQVSKRVEISQIKLAKFNDKLKQTKTNCLHKSSAEIIRENQTIVLEIRHISRMVNNPNPPLKVPSQDRVGVG